MNDRPYIPGAGAERVRLRDGDDFLDDELLDQLLLDVIGRYEALGHIEQHGVSVRASGRRRAARAKASSSTRHRDHPACSRTSASSTLSSG